MSFLREYKNTTIELGISDSVNRERLQKAFNGHDEDLVRRKLDGYMASSLGEPVIQPEIPNALNIEGEKSPFVIEWTNKTTKTYKESQIVQIIIKGITPDHEPWEPWTMPMCLPFQSLSTDDLLVEGNSNNRKTTEKTRNQTQQLY